MTFGNSWLARAGLVAMMVAASTAAPGVANAQEDFPVERFRLAMDPNGLLDIEWGAVPEHLSWDLALWLGASNDPLVIYEEMGGDRERVGAIVKQRIDGNLVGAIALRNRFQIGVQLPLILSQDQEDIVGVMSELSSFGLGDIRILPKVQLLRGVKHGVDLALLPTFTLPTGSDDDFRGEGGLSFAPELILSRAFGKVRLASNLGYRARGNTSLINLDVQDELFGRIGAGYRFYDENGGLPLELDLTLGAATAAAAPFDSFNQNHVEMIAGATYDFTGPLIGVLAGGFGINEGFGTPDWRVVLAVRFSRHRDGDDDGDGILNLVDACPKEPEDIDEFEDSDGCADLDNDKDGVLDKDDGAPNDPEDKDEYADADGVPDPDNDSDGILDADDKCPLKPEAKNGFEDSDGCPDEWPDTDGDGMADNKDQCPKEAEDFDNFEDENGCPDLDNDKDTVPDKADQCVNEAGPVANKGCPDTDIDGDTVVDRLDNCPKEPGSVENQGCKKKQLVRLGDTRIEILDKVYFATNKAIIRRKSYKLLRNVARVLNEHEEKITSVRVEGHTDNRGDDNYNLDLSQRRAESVVKFLIKEGVAAGRLSAKGYGETKPIDTNDTRKGRANNRRVEFNIGDAELRTNIPPTPETAPATPPDGKK